MGLFDMFKKKVAAVVDAPAPVVADDRDDASDDDGDDDGEALDESRPDLAGFSVERENDFFHAVLHMESDGQYGGTDESRAEIEARFEIRDRRHWQHVRDSVFSALARRYGSAEEVSQRQMNWRAGEMVKLQQANTAAARAGGEMNPVEGLTLEAWAALNAAIASGVNAEDALRGAGVSMARWQRASDEWNARMSRDTTFAITTVYGAAFQNASTGKFAAQVREATAARAANRDLAVALPMSYEQFYEILLQQAFAAKQGKDPVEALRASGLSVVDWTDLGTIMGYAFHRDAGRNYAFYEEIHKRLDAKYAAMNPGIKPDLDIVF